MGGGGRGGGTSSNIDIFLRLRPVPRPSEYVETDPDDGKIDFRLPRDVAAGLVNNQRELYEFRFSGLINMDAKQDEVFERVARPACMGALEGINSTIFAYGQTGSGKTFTITGGPERYVDRGIIPRSLSMIFHELTNRADAQFSVHISYLEIYNDIGYDLLDPNRDVKMLEDLPKVSMLEDAEGDVHMRNLTMHRAQTEEDALNLLFLGDTNRTISETPMNMASSRSHCVFTVYIESRETGKDVVKRSKLNLVDLAGSERVSKTNVDGTTLREAKYINLSLHYLEQVIIALQERAMGKSNRHIPYRNSMMTTVLKDSLGGNCKTTMIATVTTKHDQLDESISTCRFAQRVAMVSNEVMVNEELDPSLVIKRLKAEIKDLKEEIRMLNGGEEERGPLTPDELSRMRETIVSFCSDPAADASLSIGGNMMFIKAAFQTFKILLNEGGGAGMGQGGGGDVGGGGSGGDESESIRKLKLQVQHRDNEISILVSMLKKLHSGVGPKGGNAALPLIGGDAPATMAAARAAAAAPMASSAGSGPLSPSRLALTGPGAESPVSEAGKPRQAWGETDNGSVDENMKPEKSPMASAASPPPQNNRAGGAASAKPPLPSNAEDEEVAGLVDVLANTDLLKDRNKAFELFRKSYRKNEVIEENKALLRQKYELAKAVGGKVNNKKKRINELKALIEQRRLQRAVGGITDGEDPDEQAPDPEEEQAKLMIEREKSTYKEAFSQLRELKSEIEHLQMLLEQSRGKLQKDFEQWMGVMLRQQMSATGATSVSAAASASPAASPMRGKAAASPGDAPDAYVSPGAPRKAWGDSRSETTSQSPSVRSSSSSLHPGAAPPAAAAIDLSKLDPEVRQAAEPWLTGNAEADENIIKFYEAKVALMRGQG